MLGLIATPAPAKTAEWLSQYMKQKSFKCDIDDDRMKMLVTEKADDMIQRLTSALQARRVEYQSINPDRDNVSIGIFPEDPVTDFSILIGVSLKIPGRATESGTVSPDSYTFQIRTTTVDAEVHNGLWIPVHLKDPGADKPCTLERIAVSEDHWNELPVVDLVLSSHVAVSDIVQVEDISVTPTPGHKLKKPEVEKPKKEVVEEKPKKKVLEDEPPRKRRRSRANDEDETPRRRRRHEYRHRRHRHVEEAPPASAEPPPKTDECSGDVSMTQKFLCKVQGK